MSIQFNGQKYWLEVRPGHVGVEQFKDDVRKLLGLHPDQAFDITFECRVPIPLAGDRNGVLHAAVVSYPVLKKPLW